MSKNSDEGPLLRLGEETLGRLPGGGNCLAESCRTERRWTDKGERKEQRAEGPCGVEESAGSLGNWKRVDVV